MSISGTYDVVINTPLGDQKGQLIVVTNTETFNGIVSGPMLGTVVISGGKVAGNLLTWTMDLKAPLPISLDGKAMIDGDALTGSVQAGVFGSLKISGRKAG